MRRQPEDCTERVTEVVKMLRPAHNALRDSSVIEASPPIAQSCSAFSAEGRITYQHSATPPRLEQESESNSHDDYQPIVDELTIEFWNLKDELRLYKAQRPLLLRNEQLFEVKSNQLPKRRRQELEATLSSFASSMANSTASNPEKSRRRLDMHSVSDLEPLPASPQQPKTQPPDSAYASMSAEHNSSEISLGRTASIHKRQSARQKVEKYLENIPTDSCQVPGVMTDGKRSHWRDDCESTVTKNFAEKRQRIGYLTGHSGTLAKEPKFEPQVAGSSNRFHYKSLFVHKNSPGGAAGLIEAFSPFIYDDDGSIGEIGSTHNSSGYLNPQNERREGSTIYYRDAPFCVDLSGDASDWPPAKGIACSIQNATESSSQLPYRQACTYFSASEPGSWLLSNPVPLVTIQVVTEIDEKDPVIFFEEDVEDTDDAGFEFPWTGEQPQYLAVQPLEPCGLGNVQPGDHFTVFVTTCRAKKDACWVRPKAKQGDRAEAPGARLGRESAFSPAFKLSHQRSWDDFSGGVKIVYTDVRIKHLKPSSLPPPIFFCSLLNNFDTLDGHEDSSESEETCLPMTQNGDGFTP